MYSYQYKVDRFAGSHETEESHQCEVSRSNDREVIHVFP